MGLHYMVFKHPSLIIDYKPAVGDVVRVKTYAGKGITAEVVGEEREGYRLKYTSLDGLRVLCKTVPYHWCFHHVDKTLLQVVAKMFWNSGLLNTDRGIVFARWPDLPVFFNSWGELGLCELLFIAHPTVGADHDFVPRVKLLRDKKLIKRLAEEAEFLSVREAAARVLAER